MSRLQIAMSKINAWHIRIIALASLVLCIGSGSQFLANALAAGTDSEAQSTQTTNVIIDAPSVDYLHSIRHIQLRRAGVDTVGGYTGTR